MYLLYSRTLHPLHQLLAHCAKATAPESCLPSVLPSSRREWECQCEWAETAASSDQAHSEACAGYEGGVSQGPPPARGPLLLQRNRTKSQTNTESFMSNLASFVIMVLAEISMFKGTDMTNLTSIDIEQECIKVCALVVGYAQLPSTMGKE